MDQPPAIIIEGDACPDAARAEAALRDALGAAVAPSGGWHVRMNVRKLRCPLQSKWPSNSSWWIQKM